MTERTETRLRTSDGVAISAMHILGVDHDLCFVLVHGFTGSWRQERVQKVVARLVQFGGVVAIDMRGHGRSGGASTVGKSEVLDVVAAVEYARSLGYARIVTTGFSMGGAVVLREAGLAAAGELADGWVDGVVSVSAPAFWYYRGTRIMRIVHRLVASRSGRVYMRVSGTRISGDAWGDHLPVAPYEAAAMLGGVPLLIVHGDVDRYFPVEHPRAIHEAARRSGVRTELWLVKGFGHAESAVSTDVLDRIGAWTREFVVGSNG